MPRRSRTGPPTQDRATRFEREAQAAIDKMMRDEAAAAVARAQADLDVAHQKIRGLLEFHQDMVARLTELDLRNTAHIEKTTREVDRIIAVTRDVERDARAQLTRAFAELEREQKARLELENGLKTTLRELDDERTQHCLTLARVDAANLATEGEREARRQAEARHEGAQARLRGYEMLDKVVPGHSLARALVELVDTADLAKAGSGPLEEALKRFSPKAKA